MKLFRRQSLSFRAITIAEIADLVMVPRYAIVLALHHDPDVLGQRFGERLAVTRLRDVLAPFALFEDGAPPGEERPSDDRST